MNLAAHKMDLAAIPRITSVVLTGLDFSMNPENARFEADKGFIKPLPEIKVMHQIKALAVMVYNQEKMTPYYHGNVCDGRNALAYFICAVHRQQAPQPKTHSRQSSNSSNCSSSSSSSCSPTRKSKNCELPKLVTTSMLPLGYWDSLYYALVAEIRQVHSDLQNRYGWNCENGVHPLHQSGPDGTTRQAVTPIDLASMLETAWYTLMDNRLVATLDDAVRMRKMREQTAKHQTSVAKLESNALDRPPVIYGLMDVNSLSADAIINLLWDKHAPEIDRAACENFEDESMLTAYRAELHAKQVEECLTVSTPLPSANICRCRGTTCICRLQCDRAAGRCTCANRVQIYHLIHEQQSNETEMRAKYVKQDQNVPNQFLGATTDTLAQLQISAMAGSNNPMVVHACYDVTDMQNIDERQVTSRNRQRANTNNSELAYVPDSKFSHRGIKDTVPLGFYGRESGQRYPTIRPQAPDPYSARPPTSYDPNVTARKPVPPPISAARNPDPYQRSQSQQGNHGYQPPTPPFSGPYDTQTFDEAGQVTYPQVPTSQSQTLFTQSFPAPTIGNPRSMHSEEVPHTPVNLPHGHPDPAQAYIGLLSRHPSSTNRLEQAVEPFPTLTQTTSTTASKPKKAATSHGLPTLKSFTGKASKLDKPIPPLPTPDFIAPRPATKQRYVSAGGNAKLSQRSEIVGPAFTTTLHNQASGATISKEEVDAKMSDPEWVRRNFGEAAAMAMTATPPRKSGDSQKRDSKRTSGRKSVESPSVDKRDRTSSGASARVAKLKRVFSRKSSQTDDVIDE